MLYSFCLGMLVFSLYFVKCNTNVVLVWRKKVWLHFICFCCHSALLSNSRRFRRLLIASVMVEVERFLASHQATVHTVPDEFSISGKFVRLGVSFTWNHAKREEI